MEMQKRCEYFLFPLHLRADLLVPVFFYVAKKQYREQQNFKATYTNLFSFGQK